MIAFWSWMKVRKFSHPTPRVDPLPITQPKHLLSRPNSLRDLLRAKFWILVRDLRRGRHVRFCPSKLARSSSQPTLSLRIWHFARAGTVPCRKWNRIFPRRSRTRNPLCLLGMNFFSLIHYTALHLHYIYIALHYIIFTFHTYFIQIRLIFFI